MGSGVARAETQQASGGSIDVCALVTAEDAGKILGRRVRARLVKRSDGPTECRYAGGIEGTVTIVVGGDTPKAKWDEFMKELRGSGASLEPVAGVGDGACFWDTRLYAHSGVYEVTVSASPTPGDDPARVKAAAIALGNAVIGKL